MREPTSRFATEPEYRFKHILIREVAYDMMLRPARQDRHAAVTRFLERVTRERAGEWASVLAYHWGQAGNREKELTNLLLAAGVAGRSWAKGEAVALYTQALDLLAGNDPRRGSVRLSRALAFADMSDYRAAVAELDALIPVLEPRLRLEALVARGWASQWVSDPEGLRVHATEAVELAGSLGDRDLEGPALALLALAHSSEGDNLTSLKVAERAVAIWRPGVRTGDLTNYIEFTGLTNYWLGGYKRSEDLVRQAYEIGRDVHSVRGVLSAVPTMGLALAGQGRMEEALRVFAEVIASPPEVEQPSLWFSRALNMWAGVLRELQDFDEARRLNEEGIDLAAQAAFAMGHCHGGIDLLYIALATGDVGAAEKAWPRLWEEANASTMVHRWVMSGRLLTAKAQIELALGRVAEASDAAVRSIQEHRARGRRRHELMSRLALGSALLQLGRRSAGLAQLREALAAAERIGHAPSIWRAAYALGRAIASTDDKAAQAAHARAQAAVQGLAASLSPERRARFLASPTIAEVLKGP